MAMLFDPWTIRGLTMRNRVGVSPMCMYSSVEGRASEFHVAHLGSRAAGGAGVVIAEATAVEARGRISPFDAGMWEEGQIEPAARVARAIRVNGAVAGIQLAHAGRKASTDKPFGTKTPGAALGKERGGWECVGASAVAFSEKYAVPRELAAWEIEEVQEAFVAAARRALLAGYQVVEVHGAHGYLLHSFLSPLSNKRGDAYGGTFDNRIRFMMETVEKVRGIWPGDLPVWVRLSCTDWTEGGWTIEDSVALAKRLKGAGVDVVDCSSGGNVATAKIPVGPGYQVGFAEAIRKGAGIATAAVGMITDAKQAEGILVEGKADCVLLAREMLREPYWAWKAGRELGDERVRLPEQYARAV